MHREWFRVTNCIPGYLPNLRYTRGFREYIDSMRHVVPYLPHSRQSVESPSLYIHVGLFATFRKQFLEGFRSSS